MKFTFCLVLSCGVCLLLLLLLYKGVVPRALFSELPLLGMLCAGLALAITLFDVFQAAMLTLLLIAEYAVLSFFSAQARGDWELRIFDLMVLGVSFKQARLLFPAAILTAAGAFIFCGAILKVLPRQEKKDPEILRVVSRADMRPRLPAPSSAEIILTQEEVEFLLGKNEQMAGKNDGL